MVLNSHLYCLIHFRSESSKDLFVRSLFGGNVSLKKSFRFCLTFRNMQEKLENTFFTLFCFVITTANTIKISNTRILFRKINSYRRFQEKIKFNQPKSSGDSQDFRWTIFLLFLFFIVFIFANISFTDHFLKVFPFFFFPFHQELGTGFFVTQQGFKTFT